MKLERFRSDWNGQRSEKAYNQEPSAQTVQQALTLGRVVVGDAQIFAEGNLVEVRVFVGNGISGNMYRDLYRIIR